MIFNDRILAESGSRWDSWRAINNEWPSDPRFENYLGEAARILAEEYGDSELIVLKDPRCSIVLPFWKLVLEKSNFRVCHIIPFRHPEEVAASLLSRNAIPESVAKLIWVRYLLDAEMYSRGQPRVFVQWDEFFADWERESLKIASRLQIDWPALTDPVRAKVVEFLTPELRHHRVIMKRNTDENSGDDYVSSTYAALTLFERDPDSHDAIRMADSIGADFHRTERIFGPAFADIDAQRRRLEQDRDALAGELSRTNNRLATLVREHDTALNDGSMLAAALVQTRSQLDQAQRDREAWAVVAQQLRRHQRRSQLMEMRLDKFRNSNVVRRLAAFGNAGRYFDPASLDEQLKDEAFRYEGPLMETTPAAATLSLNGLLNLNGVEFLVGAYGRLLGRLPDQSGMSFYLPRLLRGIPKIEILSEISASTEARDLSLTIPGLSSAVSTYRRSQWPFLGYFVRAISGAEGNSAVERRLRAAEQALCLKNHR